MKPRWWLLRDCLNVVCISRNASSCIYVVFSVPPSQTSVKKEQSKALPQSLPREGPYSLLSPSLT